MAAGKARRIGGASSAVALAALGLLLAGMTGKQTDAGSAASPTAATVASSAPASAGSARAASANVSAIVASASSSTGPAVDNSAVNSDDAPPPSTRPDNQPAADPPTVDRPTVDPPPVDQPAPRSPTEHSSVNSSAVSPSPVDLATLAAFGDATFALADVAAAATLIDLSRYPSEAANSPGIWPANSAHGAHDRALSADRATAFVAAFDDIFAHPRAAEETMKVVRKTERIALADWHAHLADLLADAGLCERADLPAHELPPARDARRLPSCAAAYSALLDSLRPTAGGALERVALRRTTDVPVSPQQLLIAAFELDYWRPADLHPLAAAIYRWAAAGVRHSAVHVPYAALDAVGVAPLGVRGGCELNALALAGEMTHRYGRITKVWRGAAINDNLDLPLAAAARAVAEELCASGLSRWQLTPAGAAALTWTAEFGYRACDPIADVPAAEDDLVTVGGTRVHRCLALTAAALLRAADADGVMLTPSGWRSLFEQLWLRQRNCPLPPPDDPGYNRALWGMPQEACSPPTAIPRQSRHQSGVALDFSCGPDHASLTRRDSPCLAWLEANAHRFGLYNLPSEPWHWSTDGL